MRINYLRIGQKNIYEIPEVGVLPLWTDDRHAPLVVGTPWSEQVAKKTENAAKKQLINVQKRQTFVAVYFPIFSFPLVLNFPIKRLTLLSGPG